MLDFTTINVDGKHVDWHFNNIEELYAEWYKEDCDLPGCDDDVESCRLHDTPIYLDTFGDLIGLLGVGISAVQ